MLGCDDPEADAAWWEQVRHTLPAPSRPVLPAPAVEALARELAPDLADLPAAPWPRILENWWSPPSPMELRAMDRADVLARYAKRLAQLYAVGDGPAVRLYAEAARDLAHALRVAAGGELPEGLDGILARLHDAVAEAGADARLTAKGALRGHNLDTDALRDTGPPGAVLAARVEFETRHERRELQRIAGAPDLF